MKTGQSVGQAADVVDEAQLHSLPAVDHAANVGGQLPGVEHQLGKFLLGHPAVGHHELDDALLDSLKYHHRKVVEKVSCEPMTKEEMQRFLIKEAQRGSTELEAYRNLMEILGIEFPKEKED